MVGGEVAHINTYNRPKTKGRKCGSILTIWLWVWVGTLIKNNLNNFSKGNLWNNGWLI